MATENLTDATTAIGDAQVPYVALLRGDVVKIKVGPDHAEYCVHPELLSRHSEYFKRALKGNWKEAEERVITLPDVERGTFELFLEWLYTQQYPKEHQFGDNSEGQITRLKACAFGDRFMAPGFRVSSESALIDATIDTTKRRPPYYLSIIYAYEHLPPNSPVFQAFIDRHCYSFNEESDTDKNGELGRRSQLPHDFLVGVMLRYMRLQPGNKRKALTRCDYHDHTSDDEKGENCQAPRIDG